MTFVKQKVVDLPPSGIRKFFDLAASMEGCISLSIGEPDFVTPKVMMDAAIESLNQGKTAYTSNAGLIELREEICNYLKKYDLSYDAATEVLVTVGASEAIDLAFRALVGEGDEVLIPDPSFVCYGPLATMAGATPVYLNTYEKDDFRLTAEELEAKITPNSKVLLLPYPNNPTGGIMTKEDYEPIAKIVEKYNLFVICDEIYSELVYGGEKHYSFAALPGMKERSLVLNGFSKAFAMTGWRVGYACGPADVMAAILKVHQYGIMSAPTMGQYGALEGLRNGDAEVAKMVASYDERRKVIVQGFRDMGLSCFEPKGAFYCFPCIKSTGMSSEEFVEKLLMEEKVAVVPGNAFGASGEGFIRCSYASSMENIKEALKRIESFINRHKK
ncbi:MAG: aminotransferase class I/II-fold pyridoxal phosphate-dependent enzyme [Peptococcaceae bacterium]|jgi:aminotransferase|nr:aminotransferase class I/II-fold pyridoxal phosphate-dependent enzyme [Peptococcaceae bacterium]MBQ2021425.1 aminotransferase class I/II-fold pyridoxal phosphate-dependent enzyme [Peptococcaceae bacterium]MBQ5368813.1 aminotransferase class I/II-fold pyridoxal phosphate-dependent enzyme [Peptococcaceae bacterium]MBQ5668954.1 aminotransferase class I/II-fold pyridoxal phosphate-dependent enzyme [Peptococcaceae bacterium]MBQ5707679.1 aminotransferase class I/II-fold pyridoxal phosphate-depende